MPKDGFPLEAYEVDDPAELDLTVATQPFEV